MTKNRVKALALMLRDDLESGAEKMLDENLILSLGTLAKRFSGKIQNLLGFETENFDHYYCFLEAKGKKDFVRARFFEALLKGESQFSMASLDEDLIVDKDDFLSAMQRFECALEKGDFADVARALNNCGEEVPAEVSCSVDARRNKRYLEEAGEVLASDDYPYVFHILEALALGGESFPEELLAVFRLRVEDYAEEALQKGGYNEVFVLQKRLETFGYGYWLKRFENDINEEICRDLMNQFEAALESGNGMDARLFLRNLEVLGAKIEEDKVKLAYELPAFPL